MNFYKANYLSNYSHDQVSIHMSIEGGPIVPSLQKHKGPKG